MPSKATIFTHWKSSASGILVLVITTCGVLLANPLTNTGKSAAILALISALATAYVGIISKDAGTQEAIPPGGGPAVAVPSHEVPDQPGAKAIVGK
jgi:hypothetical protein